MLISRRILAAGCAVSLALLLAAATASAASITVNLRVEGSSKTLFEGPAVTSGETFEAPSSQGPHPCDYSDNGTAGGEFSNGGNPGGTPTTALRDAALANGLAFDAKWFGSGVSKNGNPGDFFVTQVGSDVEANFESWGFAVNDTTAPVGGCQIALAPGSEVLWAYNYFGLPHLLALSSPANASSGTPFTVHVTDAQNGSPIAGAAIGEVSGGVTTTIPGSPATDTNGSATITLAHAGTLRLKATRAESVRSNAISVCVHAGNDGTCGTSVPPVSGTSVATTAAPGPALPVVSDVARVQAIKSGHVYPAGLAPRLLSGVVTVPAGGTLRDVRISLERRRHGHCFVLSGSRERFVPARCGARRFFSVGASESFSYLLPARLPAGRYVFDIEAVNSAGKPTALVGGVSRVVFYVK